MAKERDPDLERFTRRTVPPVPHDAVPPQRGRASDARVEDPPPQDPPAPARPRQQSLGRIALNAPPVSEQSQEERILRAIAQSEQAQRREAHERAAEFEEAIKSQIRSIVTTEVKHSTPPPPPEKSFWAHVGPQLPATVAAIGAVIVAVSQSCSGSTKAITDRLDASDKREAIHVAERLTDLRAQRSYDLSARYWTQDVLEALDVKITDPLGAPDRPPATRLEFWPAPKPDLKKIKDGTAAPHVQPKTPFPLPPPLPEK